jgi:GT2 family glycosyltransferase
LKDISIVILNWNGRSYLERFLPLVIQHSQDARIIVADNASTDDSVALLQEKFPSVEIIVNESNGGFAKGYNDALKHVNSNYYLLLNSDIEVTADWLRPLYELIENDAKIAGCQPKVRSFQEQRKFEHAGASGGYLDTNYFPFCRGRIFDSIEEDFQQYDNSTEIFWATGAALLIRSEVYHQLGGFDESFFAHMEEIDLCWRAKKMGYSFHVQPASVVYHVGGGTLSYMSPRKTYLNFRNSLYMIVKNHEGWLFPQLFVRMSYDGIAGIRFLMKGEFKNLWAVLTSHFSMYKNLSTLLQKRKQIQTKQTTTNRNGFYKGNILWAYYFKRISQFSKLNQRLFITDKNK